MKTLVTIQCNMTNHKEDQTTEFAEKLKDVKHIEVKQTPMLWSAGPVQYVDVLFQLLFNECL